MTKPSEELMKVYFGLGAVEASLEVTLEEVKKASEALGKQIEIVAREERGNHD